MGDRMEAAALVRHRHGETHRVVLLTMLADDYAHLHDQMMCSLKRIGLSSNMVIATDKQSTCDSLLPEWRAQCFQLDPALLATEASYHQDLDASYRRDKSDLKWRDELGTPANTSGSRLRTELATPYDYGSAGFRRIAQMKPLLTRVGNLRGLDVLFTDGDIVFNSDPIHELYSHAADLVVQDDAVGGWTSSCKQKGDHNVNSGFYLLRAGKGSSRVIMKWLASIHNNPKLGAGDQVHLNAVLQASCHSGEVSKNAGFSWKVLSRSTYPNGRMFYNSPHSHGYRLTEKHRIVHFNWIRGIPEKLKKMHHEGLKFAGNNSCREPEAVLALDKSHGTRAETEGARLSPLPCDAPPYVLDGLHYDREGTGSSIWPHSTSIIFADAIGASWIDDPESQGEALTGRANIKHPEQEASAMTPQAVPPKIWNSHDKTDYAPFLGFRHDPQCDFASLSTRINAGELQVVEATTGMYGDHTYHSWKDLKTRDAQLPKTLINLCSTIADGSAPPSSDPMLKLAGVNRSKVVFRFRNYGDHRFTGAADCLYNPRFRSRFHAARARRTLQVPSRARPGDELWLSVHYRAGDVKRKDYIGKGRGDLGGLAYYVRGVLRYLASEPERLRGRATGLRPVVHLFSEGAPHDFKRFTDLLPDAVLHLGNNGGGGGGTTKHDIDLMTQSHMLIGGYSTFFQMAAHLCDACVVLSTDVAHDAERMDGLLGKPWPRANQFVKLHHESAADESFDAETFGRALAKVLAVKPEPEEKEVTPESKEEDASACGSHATRVSCMTPSPAPSPSPPPASPPFFSLGGAAFDKFGPYDERSQTEGEGFKYSPDNVDPGGRELGGDN